MSTTRIANAALRAKLTTAEAAAALIPSGATLGLSGFTGSGYPKAVPMALAARIEAAHAAGDPFQVRVWTGASTGPELDGALARADGIEFRLPYNSDPVAREKINSGKMEYFDMHLSQVAPMAWQGFLGDLDIAVIEVTGIRPDGALIPSSSYQRPSFLTDMGPFAHPDGCDGFGLIDEAVPCVAGGVDDVVVAVEDAV
jgi:succinyl-CoA:acetate CoA-transferase